MNKIFILSTVLATALFANSIGQDEQYTNTNDKSVQKNSDQSATDEKSKSISKEKGQEVNQGSETSKSKEKERTLSTETSQSDSKSKSIKRVIDMQATMMMPEVDYLVEEFINKYTKDPRIFMEWLPIRETDWPEQFQELVALEKQLSKDNYMYYADKRLKDEGPIFGNQDAMKARWAAGGKVGLDAPYARAMAITTEMMDDFGGKYHKLFNQFFFIYGLPSAEISTRSYEIPKYDVAIYFYPMKFITDVSGGWSGNFVFTIKNFFDNDLKFFNKDYILQTKP